MSTKHMVGIVDRCGQQNTGFAIFIDLIKIMIQSIIKPVFDDIDGYAVLMSCSDA